PPARPVDLGRRRHRRRDPGPAHRADGGRGAQRRPGLHHRAPRGIGRGALRHPAADGPLRGRLPGRRARPLPRRRLIAARSGRIGARDTTPRLSPVVPGGLPVSAEGGTKAVIAALTANSFIALCKFGGWALTQSSAMLAEAIHSVADAGNQALLLVGGRRAQRQATPEHPFGYGRERYIFAFLVAIVLFSVGGVFALYEAYHKYEEVHAGHPNELLESQWWWVPLAILVAAIVAEGLSFRTAIKESGKTKGRQSWSRFIRSAKAPELPVILLEDFAALVGLVFALAGVGL